MLRNQALKRTISTRRSSEFSAYPELRDSSRHLPGGRFLLNAACLVVVVFGLRAAAPILVPFALAVFLTILSLPFLYWLTSKRVPFWLAVVLAMLLNIAVLSTVLLVLTHSFNEIRLAAPRYVAQFQVMLVSLVGTLQDRGFPVSDLIISDIVQPEAVINLIGGMLRGVVWIMTMTFLVLIIMIFVLAEAHVFPAKLRAVLGRKDADLSRFSKITHDVQRYLGIKTVVSLITGTLVGLWTWLMGLDFPLLWGLIAFLFNYVPSIGSILASVPAILIAMVQYGIGHALIVGLGYLVINVSFGNIIEPNLMGRRLGLSTVVVILSLLFWGWVWGPIGMLLSLPLTMIVKIMLENTRDFRWVAIMLSGGPPPEASPTVTAADEPPS